MTRAVQPLRWPSDASLKLPGSKSVANRALVAAALSGRVLVVEGATPCDDVRYLVAGLQALGFEVAFEDEITGRVRVGPRGPAPPVKAELFCGNAGTALRFLLSVAATLPGEWTLSGDVHMQKRPIGALVDTWRALGVEIEATGGCPPVHVKGGTSVGGSAMLDPSISSQFLSSLLLVGAQLQEGLEIELSAPVSSVEYAELTVKLLAQFGVEVELTQTAARVQAGGDSQLDRFEVDGDWSSMGVWSCLAEMTGSELRGTNLEPASGQADEQLGRGIEALRGSGERELDVSAFPDQFMNLAVLAARRSGRTRLTGAANLRLKECDRIAVMAREFERIGVRTTEFPDGIEIEGTKSLRKASIDPEGDHRIAMAFALAGLLFPGIEIQDSGCVAKSYPHFWRDLEAVREATRCISVVGMRGVGKSQFARALAQRTGRRWIDSDLLIEAEVGPITEWVAGHGWESFRDIEQRVVHSVLEDQGAGSIFSLGGGALERRANFDCVRKHSIPLWLDAPLATLRARLQASATERPALSEAGVLAELETLDAARRPTFMAIAEHLVDASVSTKEMVDKVQTELASICRWHG